MIERQRKILEILTNQHTASVLQLSEFLRVSAVTIRSDLDQLEQKGQILRTHGGALLAEEDEKGVPTMVERAWVVPPHSSLTPLSAEEMQGIVRSSVLYGTYEKAVDRDSAYEKLKARAEQTQAGSPRRTEQAANQVADGGAHWRARPSAARAIGSQVGRQIIRGVLGSIFGGGKR